MPQLVQVDGVGQVEFGDEFTPADIARQVDSLYLRKEKADIGPGVAGRAYGALGAIGDGIQWGFKKLNWAISSIPASVADVAEGWMSAEQNAELMNAGEAEPGGFRNLKAWWHGATTQYQPTWKEIDESPDLQNHFWESVGAKTSKAGADLLPRLALMKGAGALGAGQAAAGAAAFAPGEEGFNARGAILGALVPATQQLGKQAAGAVLGKIGGGALPAVAQKSIEEMGGLAAIQTLNEALALPDRVKQFETNPDDFWQQIAADTVVNLGFLALSAPGWKAGTPSETQQFISRRARNLPVPSVPSVPEVPFTPIDVAPPGAKPPTPEEAAQPTAREEARAEFEARREQARLEAEASRAAARTRTVPPVEPEAAPSPFVGPVLPPPAAPAAPVQDERARRLAEIEARVAEARTPPQFIGPGEAPPGQVKVTDQTVYEEAKARLEAQRAELEAALRGNAPGAVPPPPDTTPPANVAAAPAPAPSPAASAPLQPLAFSPEPSPTTTAFDHPRLPTIEFPVNELKLSKDVPNFKGGASETTGTVRGAELQGKYERTGTAPIVVWERLNGDHEVITGRHRLELARRTGEKTIPTQIVREADGFTKEMALTFDAEANIRDGQGEVSDYATYFKGTPITEAEARARGLLGRAKGRAGFTLAKSATDEVYSLWRAGKIDETQAVAIAATAPGDSSAQQIGSKFALQGKPADFLANVIKASQAEAGQRAQSLDLFGRDDSAMKQMELQAKRASQFEREIAEQIRAVSGAVKRPDIARKLGVDVKDPAAIAAKLDELRGELARWGNWPLQADLVARVKGLKSSEFTADNPPKLYQKVLWRGQTVEVNSAPKHASGTIRIMGDNVDVYVPISELSSVPFNLAQPESIAEQQARLATEAQAAQQKAAAERLAEGAAKPLVGTVGDIGQKDMFGGEDLFASPGVEASPGLTGMGESDVPKKEGAAQRQPSPGSPEEAEAIERLLASIPAEVKSPQETLIERLRALMPNVETAEGRRIAEAAARKYATQAMLGREGLAKNLPTDLAVTLVDADMASRAEAAREPFSNWRLVGFKPTRSQHVRYFYKGQEVTHRMDHMQGLAEPGPYAFIKRKADDPAFSGVRVPRAEIEKRTEETVTWSASVKGNAIIAAHWLKEHGFETASADHPAWVNDLRPASQDEIQQFLSDRGTPGGKAGEHGAQASPAISGGVEASPDYGTEPGSQRGQGDLLGAPQDLWAGREHAMSIGERLAHAVGDVARAEAIGPRRNLPRGLWSKYALPSKAETVRQLPDKPDIMRVRFVDGSHADHDIFEIEKAIAARFPGQTIYTKEFLERGLEYNRPYRLKTLLDPRSEYNYQTALRVLRGDRRAYGQFIGFTWWSRTGYMGTGAGNFSYAKRALLEDIVGVAKKRGWRYGQHGDVLYVDSPLGQMSFHRPGMDGLPEYTGEWSGVRGETAYVLHRLFANSKEHVTAADREVDRQAEIELSKDEWRQQTESAALASGADPRGVEFPGQPLQAAAPIPEAQWSVALAGDTPAESAEGVKPQASPAISGGAELPPEPPKGGTPTPEDDPHHSVMDAVPLGMQEGVQLIKAFTGSFPKIREVLRALGGKAAGVFRHTDAEHQVRDPETGKLEWVSTGKEPKGSVELRADIFDVVTAQEKLDLREQAREAAEFDRENAEEIRAAGQKPRTEGEIYQQLLKEFRESVLPERHSVEALKVIFHEIGHVIDWLPNNILRGRGNFFGHIATLKNYLKHILPVDPNKPSGEKLTAADKARIAAEALRQMREEVGPMREIIRQIIVEEPEWKITGITADDVKNILGQTAGKETPELTRWFAEQDRKVKADILRKAMRGLLDERLAALGKKTQIGVRLVEKTVRERVGREPTPAEVKQRLAELLAKEMRARNLAELAAVKAEMYPAIAWWRGTETVPEYFKTASEMYAEAFSMFFNNPAGFAKRAPITARLIWNYLERKPEVGQLYDKIQSQIKSGEIYKRRVENLHDMWTRDNATSLETGKARRFKSWRDFYDNVAYHIDRIGGPVYRAARGTEREGALRQAWGDFLYRAAEHERYFAQSNRDVGALLVKHNLDWNHDFGEYLYHQRVLKERFSSTTGAPLANPLGWDVKDSTARLAEMRDALGPERWAALEEAGRRFYAIHQDFVVSPVTAGKMFSPELNQVLADRTHYATFSAVRGLPDNGIERMIETQYGTAMTPHIYRQIGNLGEIKNPATATMLKGASLISAVARNTLKRELVRALRERENYPGEHLKPAEMTFNGRNRVPRVIDGPEVGTIVYLEDGKPQAFYVRKLLADSVNGDSPLANHATSVLTRGKGLLKGLFTQQPGFWAFNLVRDTAGFWAQMPGLRAPVGWARALPRAIVAARASVKGQANPYADAALQRRMLISRMEQGGSWSEVSNEWEQRVSGYGFDPAAWNREITATERALKIWHEWMGWGKTIERTNKLAGMIYLDEFAPEQFRNAPEWQKREWVRGLSGSPDFLERGRNANAIDWAFLFYNPWKEGMRSLVKAARTDPVGFSAKTAALMLTPTIMQALAYNGAFGDDLKKRYRAVGLYDLTNYLLPHVSAPDKNGAVGVFRLPLFEPQRVLHGMLFQMLTGQSEGMLNHAGGQLPGLNPLITGAYQWASYLTGHNPPDFFRSTNLLTDQQQAARGGAHGMPGKVFNASALATMAQQTWNNLGGTILYRFRNLNLENPPETDTQKILNAPVLNNIVGRWYKVTDAGVKDQARLIAQPVAAQEAQFAAAKDVMLEKLVNQFWPVLSKQAAGQPITPADRELLKKPIEWTKSERALLTDPHFQQYMVTREKDFARRFAEIMVSRMSPAMRAKGVGSSQAQDIEILKQYLQPYPGRN